MSRTIPPFDFRHPWGRVLDLLYPPRCVICEEKLADGRSLCPGCDWQLPRLTDPFCQSCGEGFPGQIEGPFSCPNCSSLKFAFEFARPAMTRDDRTLAMIHRLKYGRELHLAQELGRLAAQAFSDPRLAVALEEKWPLVPVPLHRTRQQLRHFNQAAEISRSIAEHIGLPVLPALDRIRSTAHQTALTRSQRLENLRGAFVVNRAGRRALADSPAGVVLIDDVLTTGSTVDECAKVLRRAGFKRVCVVTVMRG
jgi:competence protein ComFC